MNTKPVVKTLADSLAKNRGLDSEREMRNCMPRNYSKRCTTYHQKLKMTNFLKTVRDLEVRAPVITMHYSLAQVQLQIPGETLRDVETDASADTLLDTLAKLKSQKVGETLTAMKIPVEVLTLAGTLADMQTKTVAKI